MNKFKVGDKVKVLKTRHDSDFAQVGCIGTVCHFKTYDVLQPDYMVSFSGSDLELFFEESELELVTQENQPDQYVAKDQGETGASKFKVGDKVKINSSGTFNGKVGVILKHYVKCVSSDRYRVKFDYIGTEFEFRERELELITGDSIQQHKLVVMGEAGPDVIAPLSKDKEGKPYVNALGGVKNDQGKVDYTYLLKDLPRACESVTKVLMYGGKKYDRLNWNKVETERYESALLRHCVEYLKGNIFDDETKEHHLSHLVCCAMFIIERELRGNSD